MLQLILTRTRIGLSIRAVSDDLLGALYAGVDADRVIVFTFALLGAEPLPLRIAEKTKCQIW